MIHRIQRDFFEVLNEKLRENYPNENFDFDYLTDNDITENYTVTEEKDIIKILKISMTRNFQKPNLRPSVSIQVLMFWLHCQLNLKNH